MGKTHRASKQSTVEGVTLTEIAQVFGKGRDTIRAQLVALNPISKRGKENLYSLPAVQAVMDRIRPKGEGPANADREDLEKKKLDLQCQRLQIDIDERLGKLLPVDEVRRHFATYTSAVTTHTRKLGGEIAPLLQGLSVAKMEKKIDASGEEMIAKIRGTPYDD
jgi:hypothetical protein